MAAPVLLPGSRSIPRQRSVTFQGNLSAATAAVEPAILPARTNRAEAYQRVLHQLMRREWHVLAEIAAWAAGDDRGRARALAHHAELLGRVLLHHHAVERERVWPALRRAAGDDRALEAAIEDWTGRCAAIDNRLRDVATAARQWTVTGAVRAQDAFAAACLHLAEDLDRQTAAEEATLLPLLARHLSADEWRAITRAARCPLSVAEQQLVLGLALEDAPAAERAGVLRALPLPARVLWRSAGRARYRAAVVRLRGAPPAA
jgi:hypothetical protein